MSKEYDDGVKDGNASGRAVDDFVIDMSPLVSEDYRKGFHDGIKERREKDKDED